MNHISRNVFFVLLLLTGFGMFFANHSIPLADPVEPVFAEIAREMSAQGDYLSPRLFGDYLLEVPPLYSWLVAGAFHVFGVNEFAARFPAAVMAVLTVMMTYVFSTRLWNERVGFWSGMILASSMLFYCTGKASVTDTTCLFLFTGALLCFLSELYWLMYVFCGLLVLCLGILGLLLPFILIFLYSMLTGQTACLKKIHIVPGLLLSCVFYVPWCFLMYEIHGTAFLQAFIQCNNMLVTGSQAAAGGTAWWHYIVVLLAGIFPWTGLLFKSVKDAISESKTSDLRRNIFLQVWWIAPFALSGICRSKQADIVILAFPALAILISWNIERMIREDKNHFKSWAFAALLSYIAAAACWIVAGRHCPGLEFGGTVTGIITLLLGGGIMTALLVYRDGMLAAWLHAATGLLTMIIVYSFLLPVTTGYYSVKELAETTALRTDAQEHTLYVDSALRPGFMFYTGKSGAELEFRKPETIRKLWNDPSPKYVVIRRSLYERLTEQQNGSGWNLLTEKNGICVFYEK